MGDAIFLWDGLQPLFSIWPQQTPHYSRREGAQSVYTINDGSCDLSNVLLLKQYCWTTESHNDSWIHQGSRRAPTGA